LSRRLNLWNACPGILLFLCAAVPAANGAELSLRGSIKGYGFVYQPPSIRHFGQSAAAPSALGLSSSRFRFQISYRRNAWLDMDVAYDIAPRIQSSGLAEKALLFEKLDPFVYRAADLRQRLHPGETDASSRFVLGQNLDRAAIALHADCADMTLGRQAIAWGSARVVNPTDVLAPFTFETLDTEERIGIDAARVRIPLGALGEMDSAYIFGRHFKFANSAFYTRARFNAHETDITVLIMGFRENLMAGFDMARSLGGAGFWLETAYVFVDTLSGDGGGPGGGYFRASSGLDFNFTPESYAFIEYHFNGAGASLARDYPAILAHPAYTKGSVYLMSRHYLIPGISHQLSPLVLFTAQCMINAADPSAYLTPQIEYNIAPNTYVGAGAFIGIGEDPDAAMGDIASRLRSEFGSYPDIYFGSIRHYF